jgi:hypothetical protein
MSVEKEYKLKNKDIPKFTRNAYYSVNVGIKDGVKSWIEDQHSNVQLNPDFQRGHVWNQNQQIKYIEFLFKGGITARDIYFNHPGWMKDYKGDFVCVDGLQRLTSVLDFVNNKFSIFSGFYSDDIEYYSTEPNLIFHVNNLQTRKEVLQWYLEFNSEGTIHTEEELDKVRVLLEQEK